MINRKFYGKRICFSLIILFLVSVYFSVNVGAGTNCEFEEDEYCSIHDNGGQTQLYLRGGYCYYKQEVKDDSEACAKRTIPKNDQRRCWATVGRPCGENEKCTATGCVKSESTQTTSPPPTLPSQESLSSTKPVPSKIPSCGDFGGWCTGSSIGLVSPSMDFGRGVCNYPVRETGGDLACSQLGQDKKCWKTGSDPCLLSGICTVTGCCVPKFTDCGVWSECKPGIVQSRSCKDVNKCNPFNLEEIKYQVCPTIETLPLPKKDEPIVLLTGGDVVESGIADRNYDADVFCPSGKIITELQAYYYCLNVEDRSDRDKSGDNNAALLGKSKFCPLNTYGGLGLNVGGKGSLSVRYTFSNEICGDPCPGFVKKGKLIAKCGIEYPKVGADFDNNNVVNVEDFKLFSQNFAKQVVQENAKFDLDRDRDIDFEDFFIFAGLYLGVNEKIETTPDGGFLSAKDAMEGNRRAKFNCPAGSVIEKIQSYYYCPQDPADNVRKSSCSVEKIQRAGSGIIDGGVGEKEVEYYFDNNVCKPDPCPGIDKKGRLIVKCSSVKRVEQPTKPAEPPRPTLKGDFDNNDCFDMGDFNLFKENFGKPTVAETKKYDMDSNNEINFNDFFIFTDEFGKGSKCRATKVTSGALAKTSDVLECTPNKRVDFSKNRKVDMDDYFLFANEFGKGINNETEKFDLDGSGKIDLEDFFMFALEFGRDVCSEVLGDGAKSSLNNCNVKCDDVDGCNCLNNCVYGNIEQGQTCGDKKPEEKTAVERIVETVKNIFTEPNHCEDGTQNKDEEYVDCGGKDCKKCLDAKEKSKACKNLGYGEKCEVEFNVKVNAGKGSGVNLPVVFEYKGKKISKDSVLAVSGVKSSSEIPAVTGSTVWDVGFTDVTGNVVQDTTTGSSSRFNCVLVNKPEICCPFGFRTSSQDPNKCVRDEIVVILEKNSYNKFLELAQKYLNAKGEEKERLKEELKRLE
ncbi:hypothetical protein HYV89_00295 [Candidatus Woesearchaeota archaeon]|nr:hypothetical protein [Candidatus Woesearchaeota archaeon]